jgi:hypothetical protein
MEDVLDLYEEMYDAQRPVVCFDETPVQLVAETRKPQPVAPGRARRYDYEYERRGTANIFMVMEPLAAWRHVTVTEHRTKLDFAAQMKELVDVHYPEAEKIRVVMDNLNTHKRASLYEAFSPAEARRLLRRLEFHFTPKHASWLDMAEIELSVLSSQCLDRRIPDQQTLAQETQSWQDQRNRDGIPVKWRFTVNDPRRRLSHLYTSQP